MKQYTAHVVKVVVTVSGIMAFLGGFAASMRFWGQVESVLTDIRYISSNVESDISQNQEDIDLNRQQIELMQRHLQNLNDRVNRGN